MIVTGSDRMMLPSGYKLGREEEINEDEDEDDDVPLAGNFQ